MPAKTFLKFFQRKIRAFLGIPERPPLEYPAELCPPNPEKLGAAGENLAAWYVEHVLKMKILGRNEMLRTTQLNRRVRGELDIIAKDADTLVFIEVRTRSYISPIYGGPGTTIRQRKKYHVTQTARMWMRQNGVAETIPVRFDVVLIVWNRGNPTLKFLPDAFTWTESQTHGGW